MAKHIELKSIDIEIGKEGSKKVSAETAIIMVLATSRSKGSVDFSYENDEAAKSKFETIKKTLRANKLSEKLAVELSGHRVTVTKL